MPTLTINRLTMPDDFPADEFEAVQQKLLPRNKEPAYAHFIGAWHAISYRYRAVADSDEQFTASINAYGPAPEQPLRYQQERELFEFFSNALSVFDSFCYGMFAFGAILAPLHFPLASSEDQRKIDSTSTLKAYRVAFPNDTISNSLKIMVNDTAYKRLKNIRNVLTHRSAPPRNFSLTINMGSGSAKPSSKITNIDLILDKDTTAESRKDVSRLLSRLLKAARQFADLQC